MDSNRYTLMTKRFDVVTFMDVCVDLIVRGGDIIPKFGQAEQLVGDYSIELGGSCCIFASQAAKLRLNTAGVGIVGDDPFGVIVRHYLQQSGIVMDYVHTDPSYKTGMSIALCDANDRAILTHLGSLDAIGLDDIPNELLESARHLHIGSYFLMKKLQPHWVAIAKKAKANGMTISLDTNWDPDERWEDGLQELLPYVDIFLPNVNELKAITRQSTVEDAILALQDIIPLIVVKDGGEGAFAYHQGQRFRAQSLKDIRVVDSVGAGDSFDAGFVHGFLAGYDVETCLHMGCICGGMNTTQSGGVAGQIGLEECIRLLADKR
ncbi:sugar kinase [Paenibacillus hodogayensis]|uniref:Sugar kinase n=1 Tax=Paenibacillus hodogayensis TaxID=279208 RepID=A0ABV5W8K8_9BACL